MVMEAGYAVEAEAMPRQQKKKKIGFLKRWMLQAVKEAVEDERKSSNLVGQADIVTSKSLRIGNQPAAIDQPERAIQFTIYNANGGRVVETRRYDRKTDRSSNGLYIITSDQEFGREIDKIITMESLK